jgi:dTDP-4-dehydrorhamnose 3,5-epimerase
MEKSKHNSKIDGLKIIPLKQIPDDQGSVMHMLRSDDSWFKGFGEVYCSNIKKGAIKAWKKHHEMIQNLAVPVGKVQFVIFDDRKDSPTYGNIQEVALGEAEYSLLQIPAGLWYGFMGLGSTSSSNSLIINCADQVHNPEKMERMPIDTKTISYSWKK